MSTGRGPEVQFAGVSPFIPWALSRLLTRSIQATPGVAPYIGFALIPVIVITGLPRFRILDAMRPRLFQACFGLVCLATLIALRRHNNLIPAIGNVIIESGIGPLTQFDTYVLHQNPPSVTASTPEFWFLITVPGVIGIVAFAVVVTHSAARRVPRLWRGTPDPGDWAWIMAGLTGGAYWAAILLLIYQNGTYFDRYILPLIPIALIMLTIGEPGSVADPAPVWRTIVAGTTLFVIGALSATATADYLAWNRTRWVALHHLTVELGIPPTRIDGGYEFNGSMLYEPNFQPPPGKSSWWVHQSDYMLASGPLPGYRELIRYDVAKWLPVGVHQVIVLRRSELND